MNKCKSLKKYIVLIAVMLMAVAVLSSCGVDDIDISGYSDEKIILEGITSKEEAITIAELKALECVTKKTHSTSDKIGKVRATGPTLDTVLEQYGVSQDDFSRIEIYGEDDYSIALSEKVISENKIILAFGINGEPLDEECVPCRIIIPRSDSAYWIRMVNRIKFIK